MQAVTFSVRWSGQRIVMEPPCVADRKRLKESMLCVLLDLVDEMILQRERMTRDTSLHKVSGWTRGGRVLSTWLAVGMRWWNNENVPISHVSWDRMTWVLRFPYRDGSNRRINIFRSPLHSTLGVQRSECGVL